MFSVPRIVVFKPVIKTLKLSLVSKTCWQANGIMASSLYFHDVLFDFLQVTFEHRKKISFLILDEIFLQGSNVSFDFGNFFGLLDNVVTNSKLRF